MCYRNGVWSENIKVGGESGDPWIKIIFLFFYSISKCVVCFFGLFVAMKPCSWMTGVISQCNALNLQEHLLHELPSAGMVS
jgi:hypothetical protein